MDKSESPEEIVKLCGCGKPGHYSYNYKCEDCAADRMGIVYGNSRLSLLQQYNMAQRQNGRIVRKVDNHG